MPESRGAYLRKKIKKEIKIRNAILELIENQQRLYNQQAEKVESLKKDLNEWEREK